MASMRTASELFSYLHEGLGSMLSRPNMHGINRGYEILVYTRLRDLAFLTKREQKLKQTLDHLIDNGEHTNIGIIGFFEPFSNRLLTDEIASIYARISANLEWYTPKRRLLPAEWLHLITHAPAFASQNRCTPEELSKHFGPPSYSDASQASAVWGYAPMTGDTEWLYFDFMHDPSSSDWRKLVLRDIRLPGINTWDDVLVTQAGQLASNDNSIPESTLSKTRPGFQLHDYSEANAKRLC